MSFVFTTPPPYRLRTLDVATKPMLHLFDAFGVELEYMIVDADSLSVLPITDQLLHAVTGHYEAEIERGDIAWSNELALHVVELKTNGPAQSLAALPSLFQQQVRQINALLQPLGARLMPTAMHPWMDPIRELQLWPHEYNAVYESYNRIFDCRGHGWANLQSVHLNLPFASDEEFGRLHAAIRLVLPIMPALAASSPMVERQITGLQDTRLNVYRNNATRIPSITGQVVPEPVFRRADYEREVLQPMYDDIAPLDPERVLQQEWLNSRGAIARFDRHTIEIRVLDIQECPRADIAVCAAITAVLESLTRQRWTDVAAQQAIATQPLAEMLMATTRDAEQATLENPQYLAQFGFPGSKCSAQELWQYLRETTLPPQPTENEPPPDGQDPLDVILKYGPLSRRITTALGQDPDSRLESVYRELCHCLAEGRVFLV